MSIEDSAGNMSAGAYRSGVAARLAGIPVETLRVWERRYRVVGPRLSPRGQRLYSSVEIRRLALIKQLVDMGHPIGAIAALPTDALNAMHANARTLAGPSGLADDNTLRKTRIALVGPLISGRWLEENLVGSALRVVGRCLSVRDAVKSLHDVLADIVVIEFPTLSDESVETVASVKDACGAAQLIVLYRFAPSAVIRRLRVAGHEVARAPSDAAEIESLCRALLRLPQSRTPAVARSAGAGTPSPARFDERALSEIAAASTTVYCECPRHLVELVLSLGGFERYSAECANRGPDDAALHRDLELTAATARQMMEDALVRVAVAEGLPVPPSAVQGS